LPYLLHAQAGGTRWATAQQYPCPADRPGRSPHQRALGFRWLGRVPSSLGCKTSYLHQFISL